jgi:CubicO group peptidase (beta-lactamase class C family)
MPTFDDALRSLDEAFRASRAERHVPGMAWGVVRDGSLVHAAGDGTLRDGETSLPDERSVFRIASMTKSFTAATILQLRDEGRLRLDDPVATHVAALEGWGAATADAGPITIRQLLTMSAGLPTDDPWGDRQQALGLDAFEALLRARPVVAWTPGTTFDYSNLGYGILGRVITTVAGGEYGEVVRARLLGPLGLTSSGFHEHEVPTAHLAHGYVRDSDALVREGRDVYGALASMGGLYSTVADLGQWVAWFLDAVPARDEPEDGAVLRRASRREMQQAHRVFGAELEGHGAHLAPAVLVGGYGYGLAAMSDAELGITINHGGGYPGFGSYMVWHPGSGIGIVGLANLRYAAPRDLADRHLAALVAADGVVRRRVRPSPATEAFRPVVTSLLRGWDDAAADAAFAMNLDLDQPRPARRAAMDAAVEQLGPLEPDPDRPDESWSPAHVAWWLRGPGGWLRVGVLTTPEPEPTIQSLVLRVVRTPSPALRSAAEALVAQTAMDAPAWPAGLRAANALATDDVRRSLRAAAARFGPMALGLPVEGDGTTTARWELWPAGDANAERTATARRPGRRATATLLVDAADDGSIRKAELLVAGREAPVEPW